MKVFSKQDTYEILRQVTGLKLPEKINEQLTNELNRFLFNQYASERTAKQLEDEILLNLDGGKPLKLQVDGIEITQEENIQITLKSENK